MTGSTKWMNRAALYELLAKSYVFAADEMAKALASGEYSDAFREVGQANGFSSAACEESYALLDSYAGQDESLVFHSVRKEYTRLYIGRKDPLVTPYAGVWASLEKGEKPLLMVGKESMAIERFMRKCGMGQPEGTNEPLDHIASLLEVLYFLCLVKAEAVKPASYAEIADDDYETFFDEHFQPFAHAFANATLAATEEPLFVCASHMLLDVKR